MMSVRSSKALLIQRIKALSPFIFNNVTSKRGASMTYSVAKVHWNAFHYGLLPLFIILFCFFFCVYVKLIETTSIVEKKDEDEEKTCKA